MGSFSMTCSVSGLGISGGTPVRCILLTSSPYVNDDPRQAWILRTPPIRAVYNSYGTVEDVHKDDKFIADLWLRGLREDIVEKGLGDNSAHDVPTSKDMTFEELLDAIREGRVQVRQDTKHFWGRPLDGHDERFAAAQPYIPTMRAIRDVLTQDAWFIEVHPDAVCANSGPDKFVVDEPVPHLVRVRFGHYGDAAKRLPALQAAREAVMRAGFVGVIAAGSGRYADDADLLVFPAPNADKHARGPQWDMATGAASDDDKKLTVGLAMVREDVWQALIAYPHSDYVGLDCINCGQQSCYHDAKRKCPNKSINKMPFKKHPKGSIYAHGPVFPEGVEHIIEPREYGERVWFGLDAFRSGARVMWQKISDHFSDDPKKIAAKAKEAKEKEAKEDKKRPLGASLDAIIKKMRVAQKKEAERIAKLPAEEQAKIKADAETAVAAWEKREADKKANPHFGDFRIHDHFFDRAPGTWIFHGSVPGVIGISAHLSMCLCDKLDVPMSTIDAIAELSAVGRAMSGVGVCWKPAESTGPQEPEWDQHIRFARTMLEISQKEMKDGEGDEEFSAPVFATLAQVTMAERFGK